MNKQLDFDDVLIKPNLSTIMRRSFVTTESSLNVRNKNLYGTPIMSSNMTQTGNFEVARKLLEMNCFASLHKFYSAKQITEFINSISLNVCYIHNLFVTIGIRNFDEEIKKLKYISKNSKNYNYWHILIDVPNGYIDVVSRFVKSCREEFPDKIIAVGNVCTKEGVKQLITAGADIVKVGIGPSKVCDTRIKTGVGRPQLSTIIECAKVAHRYKKLIIADGGFKTPGDICKALVAGADICMSGSLFAGSDEASGEVIEKTVGSKLMKYEEFKKTSVLTDDIICKRGDDFYEVAVIERFKEYYGMSSFRAQKENYGKTTTSGTSEGVESMLVPYTGPIANTIFDIQGGIRSCGTYINAEDTNQFSKKGKFYKVNRVK